MTMFNATSDKVKTLIPLTKGFLNWQTNEICYVARTHRAYMPEVITPTLLENSRFNKFIKTIDKPRLFFEWLGKVFTNQDIDYIMAFYGGPATGKTVLHHLVQYFLLGNVCWDISKKGIKKIPEDCQLLTYTDSYTADLNIEVLRSYLQNREYTLKDTGVKKLPPILVIGNQKEHILQLQNRLDFNMNVINFQHPIAKEDMDRELLAKLQEPEELMVLLHEVIQNLTTQR